MRIIGYLPHPVLKITVFKMETRFTVKFENEWLEQSFRFAQSDQLESFEDIQQLIDKHFMEQVEQRFESMRNDQLALLKKKLPPSGSATPVFDDIL